MKKKVTLSIDEKIYNKFSEYCKEKGIILSKQVEFFMEGVLKAKKKK